MTLTTLYIDAHEALKINLVDEVSDNPDESIRRLFLRLKRIDKSTIQNMKQYFRKMWFISDQMEDFAESEIARLVCSPKVLENIENYYNQKPKHRTQWIKGKVHICFKKYSSKDFSDKKSSRYTYEN